MMTRNEAITTTGKYYLAPNFASIADPAYNALAEMLETVKNSPLYANTRGQNCRPGSIVRNVQEVLMDENLLVRNSLEVVYNKVHGSLWMYIPYVANIGMDVSDGWSEEFLVALARVACRAGIGLVARSVGQVLLHENVYYSNEMTSGYQWSGKPTMKCNVSEYTESKSSKFMLMGICKKPNDKVRYESDGDGFIFEDRRFADGYWAMHNTITAGMVEDEIQIHAYCSEARYGLI